MQQDPHHIPIRFLFWTGCAAIIFTLLLPSCKEGLPTEIEPEPGPVEDLRAWSTPERIALIAPEVLITTRPISLSRSQEENLHLLLTAPADTLALHDLFRMVYLYYDGSTWTYKSSLDGFGIFKPCASVTTPDGRLHFFWAGIAPEHRESPPTHRATDLYHCLWNGIACSEPVSLFSLPSPTVFRFSDTFIDRQGTIHLVFEERANLHHLIVEARGTATVTSFPRSSYPRLQGRAEVLYLTYTDHPSPPEGANDVFYRMYHAGTWWPPRPIFHDVRQDAHVPALVIDAEGTHHLVFHTLVDDGPQVDLLYMASNDEGQTWSEPQVLYSTGSFFSDKPELVVDAYNVLHLRFSHWSALPFMDNFYMTLRDGVWSEPVVLFPSHVSQTAAFMAVDGNNRIHAVWMNAKDPALYHARFE